MPAESALLRTETMASRRSRHRADVSAHPLGALTVHWRAWRACDQLDGLLIDGVDPESSAELALRARRLTDGSHRLAAELESAVAAVDAREPSRFAIDMCCDEVRAARGALLALAAQLREPGGLPRGVALTRRLLRDPASPLYEPAANDDLWRAVRAASRALGAESRRA
jgi:hypothetical protein